MGHDTCRQKTPPIRSCCVLRVGCEPGDHGIVGLQKATNPRDPVVPNLRYGTSTRQWHPPHTPSEVRYDWIRGKAPDMPIHTARCSKTRETEWAACFTSMTVFLSDGRTRDQSLDLTSKRMFRSRSPLTATSLGADHCFHHTHTVVDACARRHAAGAMALDVVQ